MSISQATKGVAADDTFNASDADLILQSSDGVDFAVHRCLLRWISPFFAGMLTLPQPGDIPNARPVINMVENAASLRLLLGFCYPRTLCPEPKLEGVLDIKRAAIVARKFECDFILVTVNEAIKRLALTQSETAYALAWRFELRDALCVAARASIHHDLFRDRVRDVAEFEDLPAASVVSLSRYHTAAHNSIQELLPANLPIEWIIASEASPPAPYAPRDPATSECRCQKTWIAIRLKYAPESDGGIGYTSIDIWSWWWTFVRATVTALRHTKLEEATKLTVRDALASVSDCPRCRKRSDLLDIFAVAEQRLREDLERRLKEVCISKASVTFLLLILPLDYT